MPDKAIFLDRDDTLIKDTGYIDHPDNVKLLDGAAEALIEFGAMGYKLVVVSNQSGVARGIVSEKNLGEIHERLQQLLVEKGAHLDRIYYCPYHPKGVVAKYRKESDWRKPNPGMLLAAANEMDLDLSQSWVIGDSSRDIEAGSRAGCKTILINQTPHHVRHKISESKPDYQAVNIREAVNIVKKYHRSAGKIQPWNKPQVKPEPKPEPAQESEPKSTAEPITQILEKPIQAQPEKPKIIRTKKNIQTDNTEELLRGILAQLKSMRRENTFGEFSGMRFIAGVVQIIVLICLLISLVFLLRPAKYDNAVFITLMFAMVFQVMALTLYMMSRQK